MIAIGLPGTKYRPHSPLAGAVHVTVIRINVCKQCTFFFFLEKAPKRTKAVARGLEEGTQWLCSSVALWMTAVSSLWRCGGEQHLSCRIRMVTPILSSLYSRIISHSTLSC